MQKIQLNFRTIAPYIGLAVFAMLSFSACQSQNASVSTSPAKPAATTPPASQTGASTMPANQALLDPSSAVEKAPNVFQADFTTTKGEFIVEVHRDWSPNGADRFYNLIKIGYYDNVAFFRVIQGFMVQFGIHGSPEVNAKWHAANIQDDPASGHSNARGNITFATAGPNTRTTQVFINFKDNSFLDSQGFTPFGQVIQGMDVVDSLYAGYGEGAPSGAGPDQGQLQNQGNTYLQASFPQMDYVKTARLK